MTITDPYSYELPEERIAQRPVHPPEDAKMLVYSRVSRTIEHARFAVLGRYLRAGDHLIFNDTKVIPARLFGKLEDENGYDVEVVLLREGEQHEWTALGFPMRRLREAPMVWFNERLSARVLPSREQDRLRLRFESKEPEKVPELLEAHGTMPIPPYIREGRGDEQDRSDYQSVFAENPGSVAAPTASLHFTRELVQKLVDELGCRVDRLTLHVGTASFQPIFVNGIQRPPGEELFSVPNNVWERVQDTKARGGRIIAVGTTVVRALESAALCGTDRGLQGTELFIQPGFSFRVIDALVTNFHQPRTTHLLLVEALLGKEGINSCYSAALRSGYRFLSYGDGMFIV